MTPEEIRKQMMGSAGLKEDNAETLYTRADACFKKREYPEAFARAKRAADQGHAAACSLVGVCLEEGLGVEKNLASAKAHYERAAEAGSPEGMRNFALSAINDAFGVPNYEVAVSFLNRADEAGDFAAPGILGWLYLESKGVEKDPIKAVALLKKGIDRGDDQALHIYAECLKEGSGVAKNLQQALEHAHALRGKGYKGSAELAAEIEAEITGRPVSRTDTAPPSSATHPAPKQPRNKAMMIAVVLAFFFGPLGVFYVSWKRALLLLLLFIVGVALIPKNGFVVLLLWLVVPILSIIALGVGRRQDELTPDEAFWSGKPPAA